MAMATSLSFFFFGCSFLILNTCAFSSSTGYNGAGTGNNGMQFTYSGSTGPNKWGSLDPKFSSCSNGKSQSPVDINLKQNVVLNHRLKPLKRHYNPSNATLVNNLVNVGLHYGENDGELITDGKIYHLKQMHWHTPSEHKINGVQFPAELHLVHVAADNVTYSVVGLLYRLGKADPLISKIQNQLHKLKINGSTHEIPLGRFNLKELKRNRHKYFMYMGSFTTPPCTENVKWHILAKVRSISHEQIEALRAPLVSACKHNSRPVQPLNGRQIQLFN